MKKSVIFLVGTLLISMGLFGQSKQPNTYLDALELARFYNLADTTKFYNILSKKNYGGIEKLKNNPFFNKENDYLLNPMTSDAGKNLQELFAEKFKKEENDVSLKLENNLISKNLLEADTDLSEKQEYYNELLKSINETDITDSTWFNQKMESKNDSNATIDSVAIYIEKNKRMEQQSKKREESENLQNEISKLLDAKKIMEEERLKKQNQKELNSEQLKLINEAIEELERKRKENSIKNTTYNNKILAINTAVSVHDNYTKLPKTSEYTIKELSGTTGSWQAAAINGTANFMAGRFKQEVLQMVIKQLFKEIKIGTTVKSVFPKTYEISKKFSNADAYYSADLELLRQTVQIDIENLPYNIGNNLNIIFPKMSDKAQDMITVGKNIVSYSNNGYSLNHLFTALANEKYNSDTIQNFMQTTDLFSQALLADSASVSAWINPLNVLPKNLTTLESRFFYGLLYQQLQDNILVPDTLKKNEDLSVITEKLQMLCVFSIKLDNLNNFLKFKNYNIQTKDDYFAYINAINQSIHYFATSLNNLNSATEILPSKLLDKTTDYLSLVEYTMQGNYQKAISNLLIEMIDEKAGEQDYKLIRTLTLLSQLPTVQNSKEMENLLQAHALPMGSSSIKRKSRFNLSVNGYVGLTYGFEWDAPGDSTGYQNFGLSAPIGLALTTCGGKWTFFGSVLDLGSILNVKLKDNSKPYDDIKIEHFFTPGLGVFYNIPQCPVTIGAHWCYVPYLRKEESKFMSVFRVNASVLVDIPLFTLVHKDKKPKAKK
ncbi:MAG: hypothetical protein LBO74_15245 [Candidatus Symbiothrix sp.]|jgi:hypothetical protein|nr:hypothetical protein [Candidatus Symbiothrix sp.]